MHNKVFDSYDPFPLIQGRSYPFIVRQFKINRIIKNTKQMIEIIIKTNYLISISSKISTVSINSC